MRIYTVFCLVAACCIIQSIHSTASGADHLDSPALRNSNGTLDINDLYAFQSPADSNNFVMILTTNPLAGVRSSTEYATNGVYEFNIDVNADAVPDFSYRIYFAAARNGAQRFVVTDRRNRTMASGLTGAISSVQGGGRVTAGLFDDPFFFDLNGFQNGFKFTGNDFFAGLNVNAIVMEIPRSTFGVTNIAVTARTMDRGQQLDRMGRPAINTVLISSERKDLFNVGMPIRDPQDFGSDVVNSIVGLGRTSSDAMALASVLLPDQLTVDTASSASFLNGRKLADDVIDVELKLLTGNNAATDGVNMNDKLFRSTFPYLALPH